jgi:hypothetical protein
MNFDLVFAIFLFVEGVACGCIFSVLFVNNKKYDEL